MMMLSVDGSDSWRMLVTSSLLILTISFCPTVLHAAAQEDVVPDAPVAEDRIIFARMPVQQLRTELLQWLAVTGAERSTLENVMVRWADEQQLETLSGEELLDMLVESFAAVDPATTRLLDESYSTGPMDAVVFDGIREAPVFRNQVQQFRARWLVQHRFYDEALPALTELTPETVVDPAGLLFYRAICQSQLSKRREALDSLSLLLNNTSDVPQRFGVVAQMLQKELASQKDDGMNKVTQLMQDVERRLDLGRSGQQTHDQEQAVIAARDQLLQDMEDQKKKQNSGGGGGDGSQQQQSTQGAGQSAIRKGSSTGEADSKELSKNGEWGSVDQKTEAKARELILKTFPSNFLDQIGRYTRKMAEQEK